MRKITAIRLGPVFLAACAVAMAFAAEEPSDETRNEGHIRSPESRAKAREMLEAAKRVMEPVESPSEVGTTWISESYPWLTRRLEAERFLAENDDEQLDALRGHLGRTIDMFRRIKNLYEDGVVGGEAETYFAWKFYVAEAESWLIEAGDKVPANPDADVFTTRARAGQAMLDAAKSTYQATAAAFGVGRASSSDVHHWSREWMYSKQRLIDTEKQAIASRRDHLKRMQQLYVKCKALQDGDGDEGRGENLHAATYYVAEAEFDVSRYDVAATEEAD